MVTTGTQLLTLALFLTDVPTWDLHMFNASDLADPQWSATLARGAWEQQECAPFIEPPPPPSLSFCQRLTFLDGNPNGLKAVTQKPPSGQLSNLAPRVPKFTQEKTHANERKKGETKSHSTICHFTFFGLRVCDLQVAVARPQLLLSHDQLLELPQRDVRAVENHRVGAEFRGEFIVNVSHGEFAEGRRRVVQNRLKEEQQFLLFFCFLRPHRRRMVAVAMAVSAESCSQPAAAVAASSPVSTPRRWASAGCSSQASSSAFTGPAKCRSRDDTSRLRSERAGRLENKQPASVQGLWQTFIPAKSFKCSLTETTSCFRQQQRLVSTAHAASDGMFRVSLSACVFAIFLFKRS